MNLLAIVGSQRKGKATDTLVDRAIEGYKSKVQNCNVKKLNVASTPYRRNNPTLKALIEFDKIIMSLYMLDYIDHRDMRSNIHAWLIL